MSVKKKTKKKEQTVKKERCRKEDGLVTVRLPGKLIRLVDVCAKGLKKNRTEYIRDALIKNVEDELRDLSVE